MIYILIYTHGKLIENESKQLILLLKNNLSLLNVSKKKNKKAYCIYGYINKLRTIINKIKTIKWFLFALPAVCRVRRPQYTNETPHSNLFQFLSVYHPFTINFI